MDFEKTVMKHQILMVEDDPSMRQSVSRSLEKDEYQLLLAGNLEEGRKLFDTHYPNVMLLDLKLPDGDGRELFDYVRAQNSELPVIILTAFPDTLSAISMMKKGAYDYLVKPFDLNELRIQIRKALELQGLRNEVEQLRQGRYLKDSVSSIIGSGPAISELRELIEKIALSDATVLITGESGTGKEVVAENIHHLSNRSDFPLITVNCAAIPDSLLEGELFGTEKGAYTGADANRKGLFELANQGTLLLDEIGEMPLSLQPKLLRVLENLRIKRLGAKKEIQVNVRVIASTNQDFSEKLKQGDFREDLFYRLNILPVHIPPLRERKDDIPELADYFLEEYARQFSIKTEGFSEKSMEAFVNWCWPGNVRELKNLIERLVILHREQDRLPCIEYPDLPSELQDIAAKPPVHAPTDENEDLLSVNCCTLAEIEAEHIRSVFRKMLYNKSHTAKNLGITRNTLKKKLSQYGISEH